MVNLTHSTKSISEKEIKRNWYLVDVRDKILGRITPGIAKFLQGKNKSNYVSYLDMGDYVVVINAAKVKLSGRKAQTKLYTHFSGYPGGLKKIGFKKLLQDKPEDVIKHAVSGMLPKNKQRDNRLSRLFVFADEKHPYKEKFKAQSFDKTQDDPERSRMDQSSKLKVTT